MGFKRKTCSKAIFTVLIAVTLVLGAMSSAIASSVSGSDPVFLEWVKHFSKANVSRKERDLEQQEEEGQKALKEAQKLADEHGDTFFLQLTLRALAQVYCAEGKADAEEDAYKQIIALEAKNADQSAYLGELGAAYIKHKKYAEAEDLYRQAIETAEKREAGGGRADGYRLLLIRCYLTEGKGKEAKALAESLVERLRQKGKDSDWWTRVCNVELAKACALLGQIGEAELLYSDTMRLYEKANSKQFVLFETDWQYFMNQYASFLDAIKHKRKAGQIRSQMAAQLKQWGYSERELLPAPEFYICVPAW